MARELFFWLKEGKPDPQAVHVGFAAKDHSEVDAFYKAALGAGRQRTEAVWLFLQRRLKLLQRLRGLVDLQKHLAEKLARRCKRPGRNCLLVGTIFHLGYRLHHGQCKVLTSRYQ